VPELATFGLQSKLARIAALHTLQTTLDDILTVIAFDPVSTGTPPRKIGAIQLSWPC
jgi:hypothetical protein